MLICPPAVATATPVFEEVLTEGARALKKSQPKPKAAPKPKPVLSPLAENVQLALKKSSKCMVNKEWSSARRYHAEIFKVDNTNAQARLEAARIELGTNNFEAAETNINKALTARPKPTDPELFITLGEAMHGQAEYEDAVDAYSTALQSGGAKKGREWVHDTKILMARAHLALNPREATAANDLIKSVLGENSEHRKALLFYGEVMLEQQNVEEALPIYLRLVAASMGEDPEIKRPLAKLFSLPGAVASLSAKLPPATAGKGAGDIYGYLANQAKERSVVGVAVELYRIALKIDPNRSNYILNHVHTLELTWDLELALREISQWLAAQPEKRVGEVSAGQLAAILRQAEPHRIIEPGPELRFGDGSGISTENESALDKDGQKPGPKRTDTLTKEGLDFLALGFTICKVAFVGGQLAILPALVKALETDHRERDLHSTTIKNEAAYFGCVKQLTGLFPCPAPSYDEHAPPLYVIGDSHCLATGWRIVTIHGVKRMLRPMLVTGLKCWHMRDDEDFYPKANFEAVVSKIPIGSEVIFLFGEIDCREGILLAVEKLRYRDLEHGIDVAQTIYIDKMRELAR